MTYSVSQRRKTPKYRLINRNRLGSQKWTVLRPQTIVGQRSRSTDEDKKPPVPNVFAL